MAYCAFQDSTSCPGRHRHYNYILQDMGRLKTQRSHGVFKAAHLFLFSPRSYVCSTKPNTSNSAFLFLYTNFFSKLKTDLPTYLAKFFSALM